MLGNVIIVNPELGEPPTGKLDAGDPPVRFGGRGSSRSPYPYRQFSQGLSRGSCGAHMPSGPFQFGRDGLIPSLVFARVHLQKEFHAQVAEPLTKLGIVPVNAIPQNRSQRHAITMRFSDDVQSQPRLGLELNRLRNPGWLAARAIFDPMLRQIEPPSNRSRHPPIAHYHFHTDLTVGLLAHGSAILRGHSDRMLALLDPADFVHHPGFDRLQMRNQFLADRLPHLGFTPGTARDQLLQALGVDSQPFRHGLDRFPLARYQQSLDITRGRHAAFAAPQTGNERSHKLAEMLKALFPQLGVPFPTPSLNQEVLNVKNYLTK